VQPPSGTFPQQEYSLVEDEEGGIALLNRGLPEMEATGEEDGEVELALTLFRSVGWLSRDDFTSRRHTNAGPTLFTPEAQCRREMTFRYALLPFRGSSEAAGVREWSRRYRVEPVAVQGVLAGSAPGSRSLLRQERRTATITAIKRHAQRDTLVVRLFNPTSDAVTEVLSTDAVIESAWLTDLLEERSSELTSQQGNVEIALDPHRIATVELSLRRPDQAKGRSSRSS
jgi:alpha-mannosidase